MWGLRDITVGASEAIEKKEGATGEHGWRQGDSEERVQAVLEQRYEKQVGGSGDHAWRTVSQIARQV